MADRKNYSAGEIVDVPEGTIVTRPDGSTKTVTGTQYVLDVEGDFKLGDREVSAK